ncbi:sugar phosphate isomerase/epimerase [Paenibacillus sp. PAMC21692]|uniref:sugar phosphate isomerase/epimerase family protein n=1 Tax=Paenibacillus sp. PAMC21692 TaxID=2762320 RepID=UPI00164D7600|nr:sugar phosphate isomerase/epimerase family protein [Paenibacillus sp. PAMC21692]QNK58642.1 sugar phosphate isomerase/epimerase [Paenibacillus sp. PAMC21692]
MKLGISTYSLFQATKTGEMSLLDVIDFIADIGGDHVEVAPLGIDLTDEPEMVQAICQRAADKKLEISNYSIVAEFGNKQPEELEEEIRRVKRHVDIAAALGVKHMRHDVASSRDTSIRNFCSLLPKLADACRQIADYAAPLGITTSVENHSNLIQASDRVQMLVQETGRGNFKTTLDIGNFMCADEDPVVAVASNLPFASMIHLKDFYLRPSSHNKGEGWFPTIHGNYLRGSILGDGDINMREVLRLIKKSGYNGYFSIEFEGMEECKRATGICLDNARRIWDEV